jgi:endonuclease YncB( thermonuclease family)
MLADRVLPTVSTEVRIADRRFAPGADRGVAVLLTAASWVLQRLLGQVVDGQRGELIRTVSQARHLVVEVHCSPAALVRVRDGQRVLVEIPATSHQDGAMRASSGGDAGNAGCRRLLAVCYVGGEDLNERIVREGWALDFRRYSTDYLRAESEAKRAGAGIWRGQFTPPWEWRAARR